MSELTKTCNRCSNQLTLGKFDDHPQGRLGKWSICKVCRSTHKPARKVNPIRPPVTDYNTSIQALNSITQSMMPRI